MFKFVVNRLPWRGEEVKQRLIAEHKAGIRALAEYVAHQARIYCPVDSGRLQRSIRVISESDGSRHHIIAPMPYAEPVEFGFRMRNGRYMPPRAFMRRALRDGARAMPQYLSSKTAVRQGYHHGRLMGATFE